MGVKDARGTFEERYWSRVDKSPGQGPQGECWEWQGARSSAGYGQIWRDGRLQYTHRLALELDGRPLEPGEMGRHSCDNPPCCNPAHLEPGTNTDNMQDAAERGRLSSRPQNFGGALGNRGRNG